MALGADAGAVIRMIFWQGIRPAALGLLLGIGGTTVAARFLRALLYHVEPHDLMTMAAVTGVLLVVIVAAILVPARRASRLSPITALRAGLTQGGRWFL